MGFSLTEASYARVEWKIILNLSPHFGAEYDLVAIKRCRTVSVHGEWKYLYSEKLAMYVSAKGTAEEGVWGRDRSKG